MSAAVLLLVVAVLVSCSAAAVAGFLAWRAARKKGGGGGAPEDAIAHAKDHLTTSAADFTGVWSSGSAWRSHEDGPKWWTAGYMTGCWWNMYKLTNDDKWRKLAQTKGNLDALKAAWLGQGSKDSHDVGLVIMSAFGSAPSPDAAVLKAGAEKLARRYDASKKLFDSWDHDKVFASIIDNMMNLKILFEAAKLAGDAGKTWYTKALQHALTSSTLLVRNDGSTFHKVAWDKGAWKKGTHQGLNDSSTWTRGQAWAIYGFTDAAAYTGHAKLKETAIKCADYFLGKLPSDAVPPWDFDDPTGPKDTSAAAIAACGLFKLTALTGDAKYADKARAILASLHANYLGSAKGLKSLLCCAVDSNNKDRRREVSVGYVVADYYYLEALVLAR